mmetsp:Transcript_31956/g.39667  ORF Transcript_31956/g.39667 Transcript_31956/m.39667 type:complete len:91 (+) Transcript_31956:509-781(+)
MYKVGLMVAIGCVLGQSVTMVSTRRLKGLSVIVIQWYYALTSCMVTGIAVGCQKKRFLRAFTESTWREWLLIFTIGVLNNCGQNLSTWIN